MTNSFDETFERIRQVSSDFAEYVRDVVEKIVSSLRREKFRK